MGVTYSGPTIGTPWHWAGFLGLIAVLLALDLGVFHRRARVPSIGAALAWTSAWVGVAAAFGAWVYVRLGAEVALQFSAAYLLEKALSVDNLFVFVFVFGAFATPRELHHRVLFWGILGALVTRGAFIGLGTELVQRFDFVLYVFGAFLLLTGARAMCERGEKGPQSGPLARLVERLVSARRGYREHHFVVREHGHRRATRLFAVLLSIEGADVLFAVDSIPAALAISTEPFIVFSSNVLEVLGLRSLYFALAAGVDRFRHLRYGLAAVLVFVGGKMLLSDVVELPILLSLGIIGLLVGGSVVASLVTRRGPPTSD